MSAQQPDFATDQRPLTLRQALDLRRVQQQWQRIVDLPGVRESARQAAQQRIDDIERMLGHAR